MAEAYGDIISDKKSRSGITKMNCKDTKNV